MNGNLELLEFLKYILGCTYVSDLRVEPYNTRAKLVFERLDLNYYSLKQIRDAIEYLDIKK